MDWEDYYDSWLLRTARFEKRLAARPWLSWTYYVISWPATMLIFWLFVFLILCFDKD